MKGEDRQTLVKTEDSRSSYFVAGVTALVFLTTFISAVVFSIYILNRIDAVEREVSIRIQFFSTIEIH